MRECGNGRGGLDTGQNIVGNGGEVLERVYHGNDEIVVSLDLRQNL